MTANNAIIYTLLKGLQHCRLHRGSSKQL